MKFSGWAMPAVIFWIFGYIKSKFGEGADGKIVLVPKWAYAVICGDPSSKYLPKNTVLVVGLRSQVAGWLLILYALFIFRIFSDELLGFVVGFIGSLLLSKVLVGVFEGGSVRDDKLTFVRDS